MVTALILICIYLFVYVFMCNFSSIYLFRQAEGRFTVGIRAVWGWSKVVPGLYLVDRGLVQGGSEPN